jgi:signal transduction histidine kinase/DNA-binding response OmpR family regulator
MVNKETKSQKKQKVLSLNHILSNHFLKYSIIPIFIIEVSLLILYFTINSYIYDKNVINLKNGTLKDSLETLKYEANKINSELSKTSTLATMMQKDHERVLLGSVNPLFSQMPEFNVASNGVFYKESKFGSSLYYSSKTKIGEKERTKALKTEAMDPLLQYIVDENPNIVAAYFNSYDDMNRLYPFIDKVYEQYGEHIHMEDYNFYYLADKKHNPSKKTVWTDAYLDPAGNGWMISCITPIYNKEFLEGVSGLDITIERFVNNILDIKLPYDAKMFLVDKNGVILAMPESIEKLLGLTELKKHTYTDVIMQTITKPEEYNIYKNESPFSSHFKKILQNDKAISELLIDDKKYFTFHTQIDETKWQLMMVLEEKNIFATIYDLKTFSDKIGYIAIGLMGLFYLLFFYFLFRKTKQVSNEIVLPLDTLTEQTSKISSLDTNLAPLNTNISEINILSNNFSSMINKLNYATKAKSEFLANMSHEIRTPMNGIIGMSQLALKTNLDEKQKNYLNKINMSANTLLAIINDILDISKIEAGKLEIEKDEFNLFDTVTNVVNILEEKAYDKGLNLIIDYDTNLGKVFFGDSLRISQILMNLISNAIKFTHNGEIKLTLKKVDNNCIRIEVKDTGIGLTNEQINRIFESFTQADTSTTKNYGGTGLGLSITKNLVEMMNGKIWVESKLGKGSNFICEIELESRVLEEKFDLLRNKNVLVIDDSKTWLEVISFQLDNLGLKVDCANSGKEAIDILKRGSKVYDFILVDWNMPELDGIETSKIIVEDFDYKKEQILLMSSYHVSTLNIEKDINNSETFLIKPIDPVQLNKHLLGNMVFNVGKENKIEKDLDIQNKIKRLKGSQILLVEDNEINQELIVEILKEVGIKVDIAKNGLEGIKKYETNKKYELILMDIQMPVLDGYEATKEIRKQDKKIPIVALTANAMIEDVSKTSEVGMNKHLNKPIDVNKLYEALIEYIPAKVEDVSEEFAKVETDDLPDFEGIDKAFGLNLVMNNKKIYKQILQGMLKFKDINLKEFDDKDLKREVHTIKGISASAGALKLSEMAKEIELTLNKDLLPQFESELNKIIKEIETKLQETKIEKIEITKQVRDVLFNKLKEAVSTKRVKNCKPIIQELERFKLTDEDSKQFEEVKQLISKFKFKQAMEIFNDK